MTIWRQKSCDTICRRYTSILRYPICGFNNWMQTRLFCINLKFELQYKCSKNLIKGVSTFLVSNEVYIKSPTAWKVFKYGVFFSGPYFSVLELNTGKYGPKKTPYLDTFQAVTNRIIIRFTSLIPKPKVKLFWMNLNKTV